MATFDIFKVTGKSGNAIWLEKGLSTANANDYVMFNRRNLKRGEKLIIRDGDGRVDMEFTKDSVITPRVSNRIRKIDGGYVYEKKTTVSSKGRKRKTPRNRKSYEFKNETYGDTITVLAYTEKEARGKVSNLTNKPYSYKVNDIRPIKTPKRRKMKSSSNNDYSRMWRMKSKRLYSWLRNPKNGTKKERRLLSLIHI